MENAMSLKYIANKIGVSTATVSNVINRKGFVSQDIIDRVSALIEAESIVIKRRKKKRNPAIRRYMAFGVTEYMFFLEDGAFHSRLLTGIKAGLESRNYSLLLPSKITPENIRKETRDAEVLLLVGADRETEQFTAAASIPVSWLFRTRNTTGDTIFDNHREIGLMAAKYLFGKGHRIVGYIDDRRVDSMREKGLFFAHFMQELGGKAVIATGDGLFKPGDDGDNLNHDRLRGLLRTLLSDGSGVTALFIVGARLLAAVSAILQGKNTTPERNLEILPCVGIAPVVEGACGYSALIDINFEAIGKRAAECALWRLDNPDEPPLRVSVCPSLVKVE